MYLEENIILIKIFFKKNLLKYNSPFFLES